MQVCCWDAALLYMLTKSHLNLSLCLFGPTGESHPLQLQTSRTVAVEPFPRWTVLFLEVCGRDMDCIVQRVNALSIASVPWIKTLVILSTLKLLAQEKPHWEVREKKANHWFSPKPCLPESARHRTQLPIRGGVTFNQAPFNGCVGQKMMCTQWRGCRDHADKIPIDGSLVPQGEGIEEGMPFSPPSGGQPICWGLTPANSQEVLIKTYFAQVITVWRWHKKWARDTVQEPIISCNIWLVVEIIVLFYWVWHDAKDEFKESDNPSLACCTLMTVIYIHCKEGIWLWISTF